MIKKNHNSYKSSVVHLLLFSSLSFLFFYINRTFFSCRIGSSNSYVKVIRINLFCELQKVIKCQHLICNNEKDRKRKSLSTIGKWKERRKISFWFLLSIVLISFVIVLHSILQNFRRFESWKTKRFRSELNDRIYFDRTNCADWGFLLLNRCFSSLIDSQNWKLRCKIIEVVDVLAHHTMFLTLQHFDAIASSMVQFKMQLQTHLEL